MSIERLTPEEERKRLDGNEYRQAKIQGARVLVIDEISMLRPDDFIRVDFICKQARNSLEPFGGLQLICSGDFFQIPPVAQQNESQDGTFVLDCAAWEAAGMITCYLHEQHRQGDAKLLGILDEIRGGHVSAPSLALLKSRVHAPVATPVGIARLYTHNENVDEINAAELAKIQEPSVVYDVYQQGSAKLVEKLRKDHRIDEKLVLKKGARVMFTRNNPDQGYVNGTLGVVTDFVGGGSMDGEAATTIAHADPEPVVLTFDKRTIVVSREEWSFEEDGTTRALVRQVPLKLAWAITVHKSQGMTLDAAEIDLSRAFERGMGYVALSRVKSLENISLLGLNEMALEVSERIKKIDDEFLAQSVESEEYLAGLTSAALARGQEEFLESARVERDEDGERTGLHDTSNDLHYDVDEILANGSDF